MKPGINFQPAIIIGLLAALVVTFSLYVTEKSRHYEPKANNHVQLGADPQARSQVFEWKMATSWPKNFPGLGVGAERFAERVKNASGGRLVIKVFGGNEIVPALGVFDAVSDGSVQVGHSGAYYWKGKLPAAQFFSTIPFGLNAQEMNAWLAYGGGIELWRKLYEPFNIIPFPGGNSGIQMAGWFNKEIHSLGDLDGLKMRIPGLGGEVFKRAGGVPVNIPGGEIYTSLKTGVIDATEWVGPFNDLAFGLHEAGKYYYYPGWHEPGTTMELTINKRAFESLPKDLQYIVEQAARQFNQDMLDEYTAKNNAALQELTQKHGVQLRRLPDDVLDKLNEISQQVLDEIAADDPVFNEVLTSYRAFKQQAWDYHEVSEEAYYEIRR